MSVESTSQPSGWNCASEALADMQACPGQMQTFVSRMLDELGSTTDALLAGEVARQEARRKAEREALAGQIDRLTAAAAELAETVAEQKQLGRIA
jgi:hypothetical protein